MPGQGLETVKLPEPILSLENLVSLSEQWEHCWPARGRVLGKGWRGDAGRGSGSGGILDFLGNL